MLPSYISIINFLEYTTEMTIENVLMYIIIFTCFRTNCVTKNAVIKFACTVFFAKSEYGRPSEKCLENDLHS